MISLSYVFDSSLSFLDGVPLSVENAGNRPLSKFTRDILKEMEAKTELIEAE